MKKPVRWTIDEEIVKFLENKAKKGDRSVSYVANEILKGSIKKIERGERNYEGEE